MLKIFIGYDEREAIAFHVLAHSILRRSSVPVSITPLVLSQLPLTRERNPLQSTEFSFSRFLVPWLCGFSGRALFMDCDMLVRCDIAELFQLADYRYAVKVVKHAYAPRSTRKFLNQPQSAYVKKNWSSVMLFDCEQCPQLTPAYVNTASGLDLHQFRWLGNERLIGALPAAYNHLVGEVAPNPDAKIVHYTLGGPWFAEYRDCEFGDEWRQELVRLYGPA